MLSTRVGVGIGLVVGALVLSVPAAVAADDSGIRIRPGNASPGSTVTVSTTACGKETYGKGESEAGGAFHLFAGDRAGVLTGQFQVPEETGPGIHAVTVKCPPRVKVTDTHEITARTPSGAVDAGFGTDGKGTQLALGGALLAGAAAGAVVRMRRRPSGVRT
ncbi:sortase [Streptomyces lunaelactis]|uniref:Sortase n=1 Tax=Streptomyces lunaelactis TaxID=1535768 RepID=A0A2R4T562_9ACTN|nr:sortase [Streptomyces lunaelactis]AVZ74236.1 sortase [Streptomyces lunaelactis]NUK85218.1 sortase [Streptomyces lunaelactis]NUL03873.1 sortase [Streptomyces lunaelactis]